MTRALVFFFGGGDAGGLPSKKRSAHITCGSPMMPRMQDLFGFERQNGSGCFGAQTKRDTEYPASPEKAEVTRALLLFGGGSPTSPPQKRKTGERVTRGYRIKTDIQDRFWSECQDSGGGVSGLSKPKRSCTAGLIPTQRKQRARFSWSAERRLRRHRLRRNKSARVTRASAIMPDVQDIFGLSAKMAVWLLVGSYQRDPKYPVSSENRK